MAQNQLGMIHGHACAARRLGDALLRSFGNTTITLRLANASTGDTNSQLGLTTPTVEDVPLSPALVRVASAPHEIKTRYEVQLSTASVQQAVSMYHVDDVGTWLLTALALIYGDKVLHIDSVLVDQSAGADYLYHILASE